jgi:hypothetical protein
MAQGLRCCCLLCIAVLVCAPTDLPAQDSGRTAVAFVMDSGWASGAACRVVLSLRQDPRRFRCAVEAYEETATEYVIRVREMSLSGARPPFHRSTVRLQKPAITVTRVPDL